MVEVPPQPTGWNDWRCGMPATFVALVRCPDCGDMNLDVRLGVCGTCDPIGETDATNNA